MGTLLIVDIILCAAIENSYRNRLVSHFIVGSAGHPSKIANYCDSTKSRYSCQFGVKNLQY